MEVWIAGENGKEVELGCLFFEFELRMWMWELKDILRDNLALLWLITVNFILQISLKSD
jgi:hypothetical protein